VENAGQFLGRRVAQGSGVQDEGWKKGLGSDLRLRLNGWCVVDALGSHLKFQDLQERIKRDRSINSNGDAFLLSRYLSSLCFVPTKADALPTRQGRQSGLLPLLEEVQAFAAVSTGSRK
jgi:hypothetical protein